MAAALIPLASLLIPMLTQLLPGIIDLVHKAHPVPADAIPTVKADLNALKATAANSIAGVLLGQLATAGKIPEAASDPSVLALVAGAIEQTYQQKKTDGQLGTPGTAKLVPVANGTAQTWTLVATKAA